MNLVPVYSCATYQLSVTLLDSLDLSEPLFPQLICVWGKRGVENNYLRVIGYTEML